MSAGITLFIQHNNAQFVASAAQEGCHIFVEIEHYTMYYVNLSVLLSAIAQTFMLASINPARNLFYGLSTHGKSVLPYMKHLNPGRIWREVLRASKLG